MLEHPKESYNLVQWKFNDTIFAEYDETLNFKILAPKLFARRLRMNQSDLSLTVEELEFQDSGIFSIVAEGNHTQYETKFIQLHVHDLIRDVQIKYNSTWQHSKNMCTFHLQCLVFGDMNPSYSWSRHYVGSEQYLQFDLSLEQNNTFSCTANNSVSIKTAAVNVKCSEESSIPQKYLLIAVGTGIVGIVILVGITAACCRWRPKGKGDGEEGKTVYEDVKPGGIAKKVKRSESVVNGMSIYETVDDTKVISNMPQTLYDKINYERHPAVGPSISSPYQEVL
ncbi:uncharacterized protein si:cabz01074944.1 isoform X2 [Xyrauchen texanus]|nr:uncharacterized protein si:cabz01074944.1 isoform X2 [Xyrauchen texanus]XP_052006630.1 uncharacterized protein si:cabz01074944.1 isoform X2 [Xyrauchen texanus]XP_052006640.1 uncharacterized protein si:cabz01074944.1 isoform X2 [Xyrauchen texanus]